MTLRGKGGIFVNLSYLPAVAVEFRAKDGDPKKKPVTLYRPYASVPKNQLLDAAEQRNDCGALQELGERCWFGIGGMEQDYEAAYRYLLRAAEQKVQDAEYLIAEAYRCGYAVERDFEKYFAWLDRAASHGSWLAMFALSAAYRQGKEAFDGAGPEADPVQCFAWSIQTEKAVRAYWQFYTMPGFLDFDEILNRLMQAYMRITLQLSEHYAQGYGTARDFKQALYWLRRGKRFAMSATGDINLRLFDDEIAAVQQKMKETAEG